jgi:hypothetical protein
MRILFLLLFTMFVSGFPAVVLHAQEESGVFSQDASDDVEMGEAYAATNFKELVQAMILMGGLDINDPKMADEYAKLVYCNLYKENFSDDFEWNNIRRQIVSRVLEKKEPYRVNFEIFSVIKLERYDFENQIFPLTADTKLVKVGTMIVYDRKSDYVPYCDQDLQSPLMPLFIQLGLSQPLTFDKLKIPMDEAEELIDAFERLKVMDRQLYARFRTRLSFVGELEESQGGLRRATIRAELKSIDLFLDKEMTMFVKNIQLTKH